MAKFEKGDRIRCVSDRAMDVYVGNVYIVDECYESEVYFKDEAGTYRMRPAYGYELATPSPIPDTVTIGGVEYVRKPEPEHVWAWGQWGRVNQGPYAGKVCFVLGPIDSNGWIPVSFIGALGKRNTDGISPSDLTYIGTATIPQ